MAIALVQSNEGISTTATTTAAFAITPTNGNLIVLCFASDDYNGTPNAGWTQSTGMEQQTFHGGYLWWRSAAGGSNSFPYTIGSASPSAWVLMEFSGVHATPYDISNGTLTTSGTNSLATPSIVPTTGNRLLVSMLGASATADMSARSVSWDGSFTTVRDVGNATGTTKDWVGTGYRLVTGNGSTGYTTTGTHDGGATDARTALMIAFKEAAGVTAYTLNAASGNYALTGTAATLTMSGGTGAVPVFRSVASSTYGANAGATVCNAPAGLIDGDILIAEIFAAIVAPISDVGNIQITPPAGWTQIGTRTEVWDGSFTAVFYVFWKRAAGEAATYSFAHTGVTTTNTTQVAIAAYSGCAISGNPVDVFSQTAAVSGAMATALAITPTASNTKLVYAAHNWDGTGTLAPPTGMTERFESLVYLSDESRATTEPTGNRLQPLASNNPWAAFLIGLKPGAALSTFSTFAVAASYSLTGTAVTLTKTGGGSGGSLPVYRSVASTTYGSRTAATVCSVPAGTASGDILIAGLFAGKTGDAASVADIGITPPAGWTLIGSRAEMWNGGFGGTFQVYWKRATASEGTSYSFAHSIAPGIYSTQVVIAAYSGCTSSGSPISVFSQADADSGNASAPAVTTTVSNTKLIYVGNNWDGGGLLSPPTGMLERFDDVAYLADENRPTVATTGTRDQTLTSNSYPWSAFLIALKPASITTTYWVNAVSGSYTITGTTVVTGRGLISLAGSYSMTGRPAGLHKNGAGLRAVGGSYAVTGVPVTLRRSSAPSAGGVSVWTGSAWVDKPVKVWTGSTWMQRPVKVWNGSAWI